MHTRSIGCWSNGNSDADARTRPVARTSSGLISRSSKIADCHRVWSLTHAHSSGTCLALLPRAPFEIALSPPLPLPLYLSFSVSLLGDRLNARAALYLSRSSHIRARTHGLKYDCIDLPPDLTLLTAVWTARGWLSCKYCDGL